MDKYWRVLLFIFQNTPRLQPLLTTQYMDPKRGVVHSTKLRVASKGWSQSEKFMMNLALHLYNESNKVNLSDMDYLDYEHKRIAFEALQIRFGIQGGETAKEPFGSGMSEQDVQQFATALAERYLQVTRDYSESSIKYVRDCQAGPPHTNELQKSFLEQEIKYEKAHLFNEVIATLPDDILVVFQKIYEQLTNGMV
ncbi:hypothetical protein D3C74_140530 [compost metagenome]